MNTFNTCSNECRTWTPHTGYKYCPQSCGTDGFCAGPLDNFNYPDAVKIMYALNSLALDPKWDNSRCIKPGKTNAMSIDEFVSRGGKLAIPSMYLPLNL